MSVARYLNWVLFEKTPPDTSALEAVLRATVASCPDRPSPGVAKPMVRPSRARDEVATPPAGGGMGDIGPLKGRFARVLIDFWAGRAVPASGTVNKYVVLTLRVLRQEVLGAEQAVRWVEDGFDRIGDTSFSERLTHDRADRLHDRATWDTTAPPRQPPDAAERHPLTLSWTPPLKELLPGLAEAAKTDVDGAKRLVETALVFVARHSELAVPKVGELLAACGIKGKSRGKQHRVREFLKDAGLLVLHKNVVHDKKSGFRHGDFYFLGPEVRFVEDEESPPPTPPLTRIYSLSVLFKRHRVQAGGPAARR